MSDETMPEVTPKQREEIAERVLGKDVLHQYQTLEAVVNDDDTPFGEQEELARLTLPPVPMSQSRVRITFTGATSDYKRFSGQMYDAFNEYSRSEHQGSNVAFLATNGVIMEFEAAPQLPEVKA